MIIYATGSDVGENGVGLNQDVYGEDGVELRSYWKGIGGPQSYLGVAVPSVSLYRGRLSLMIVSKLFYHHWTQRSRRVMGFYYRQSDYSHCGIDSRHG